jgi:flagellar hook-associated protein 2
MASVGSISTSGGTTHYNSTVNGIDVDALVSATIQAKSLPITLLQNKNAVLQAKLNDYTTIKTALKTLQYAATDLTYDSAFSGRTATSSDEKVVSASATNNGTPGTYAIVVNSLATPTTVTGTAVGTSNGTKAKTTGAYEFTTLNSKIVGTMENGQTITAGSFTINNKSISVTSTDTVNTIANKISASGAGVTATVESDGTITMTQTTAGKDYKITIGATDSSNFLVAAGFTLGSETIGVDADKDRTLDDVFGAAAIADGYFSINGTVFQVDSATDTITSIVKKINASTTAGVSAYYDSTNHKISLSSDKAGAEVITVGSSSDDSDFLDKVGLTTASGATVKIGDPADATVNGVAVTVTDNKISYQGNTFSIVGKGSSTVVVADDIDGMVAKINTFITAYNAAMDAVISKETEKSDTESTDASVGDLFGDATLRDVENSLRSYTSTFLSSGALQQLSQVGITNGKAGVYDLEQVYSGHLELDETVLRAALATDSDSVKKLFGDTSVSITAEAVGVGDGSARPTYTLAHGTDISGEPTVKVDGITYTLVDAADLKTYVLTPPAAGETNAHQFSFDSTTGKITLNTQLTSSNKVTADYVYDDGTGGGTGSGIMVQMKSMLNDYTKVGGMIDSQIGSNGDISKTITYNLARITDLQYRISQEQATLYAKYQNMQTTLSGLQSQGSYITALLSSLTSSSK